MPPPVYSKETDGTLTKSQAANGYFSKAPETRSLSDDLRAASNQTKGKSGHYSGYHESALTTGLFKSLLGAKANAGGKTHTLTTGSKAHTVSSRTRDIVLSVTDGFRTDTARTIMSGPEGSAAGHSMFGKDVPKPSRVDTTGQDAAHGLLRKAVIEILKQPDDPAGITERSVATLFGAITITSMAPAELANNVKGISNLKDRDAMDTFEANRNEFKLRLDAAQKQLSPQEEAFVANYSRAFMQSTQPASGLASRNLQTGRSHSPFREERSSSASVLQGGSYKSDTDNGGREPTAAPPDRAADLGYYFTAPMRAQRQATNGTTATDATTTADATSLLSRNQASKRSRSESPTPAAIAARQPKTAFTGSNVPGGSLTRTRSGSSLSSMEEA